MPVRSLPAQCGGREPVMLLEQVVKAPKTAEAGGHRDVDDRKRCVRQQIFGEKQPAGLQILNRSDMVFRRKCPAQMAVCAAELSGQLRHALPAPAGFFQQSCGPLRERRNGVHTRAARGKLRAA